MGRELTQHTQKRSAKCKHQSAIEISIWSQAKRLTQTAPNIFWNKRCQGQSSNMTPTTKPGQPNAIHQKKAVRSNQPNSKPYVYMLGFVVCKWEGASWLISFCMLQFAYGLFCFWILRCHIAILPVGVVHTLGRKPGFHIRSWCPFECCMLRLAYCVFLPSAFWWLGWPISLVICRFFPRGECWVF